MARWTPRQPRINYTAADTVRELSTLFLTMAFEAKEKEKTRDWQESQLYLTANLGELADSRKRMDSLQDKAMELGVLEYSMRDISEETQTVAGLEITQENKDQVQNAIDSTEKINLGIQQNIDAFSRGSRMAARLDTNISGVVELDELSAWITEEKKTRGADWDASDAFKMGVIDYTYDPIRRVALERADIQLQTEEELFKWVSKEAVQKYRLGELTEEQARESIELSKLARKFQTIQIKSEELKLNFLPDSLKTMAEIEKVTLETGELNLDKLEVDINNAKIAGQTAILGMEHTKTQIALINLTIESADYEFDKNIRAGTIESIEKALMTNMEYQSEIGAMILTNMSVINDDEKLVPLSVAYATMSVDPDAGTEMLLDLDEDKYSLIENDIVRLVSSLQIGKTEEMLPDYSIFLKEIGNVKGFYDEWQSFMRINEAKIETYLLEHRHASKLEAIMAVAELDPDTNSLNIAKALQWNNTGIFDNLTYLNASVDVIQQMRNLSDTRDITRNLDIGYMQREALPVYMNRTSLDSSETETLLDSPEIDTSEINKIFNDILNPFGSILKILNPSPRPTQQK